MCMCVYEHDRVCVHLIEENSSGALCVFTVLLLFTFALYHLKR